MVAINESKQLGKLFGELGIEKRKNWERFWQALSRDHGETAVKFRQAVEARSAGLDASVHDLKNSSLGFANKIFSQYDSDRNREFIAWILRENLFSGGEYVLEIGCDSGVFLCACAVLFPDVQFYGIDVNPASIQIANQRCTKLDLKNVIFEKVSIGDLDHFKSRAYDIVFSQTTMHEVLNEKSMSSLSDIGEIEKSRFEFTPENISISLPKSKLDNLTGIREMLKDSGLYISLERVPTAGAFHIWTHALSEVGLNVDYDRSYKLSFKDAENRAEKMPITVALKGVQTEPPRWADNFSFWIYDDFLNIPGLTRISEPAVAEAVYLALDKIPAVTIQMEWKNETGTMRKIIGSAGPLCFSYTTTTMNFRNLTLVPSICIFEIAQQEFTEIIQSLEHVEISKEIHDQQQVVRFGLDRLIEIMEEAQQ